MSDILLEVGTELRVGKSVGLHPDGRLIVEVCWHGHPVRYVVELHKCRIPTVLDRMADAAVWGEPRLLDGSDKEAHV